MSGKISQLIAEWNNKATKLEQSNALIRKSVASMASAMAQNLGAVKANQEMFSNALEQLDTLNQIWARIALKAFERVEQLQYMLMKGYSTPELLTSEDIDIIKKNAQTYFTDSVEALKEQVMEERQQQLLAMRAQAEAAQQEAKEESVAEETLRQAETSLSVAGGQGSEIPDGAEVFGG